VRSIRFDHIALAVPRLVDAQAILVGQLGGASTVGAMTDAFRFWHWRFEGGGRLEVLEPAGADGFLHRFLAQRSPGIHHVTFTVPSLSEAPRGLSCPPHLDGPCSDRPEPGVSTAS